MTGKTAATGGLDVSRDHWALLAATRFVLASVVMNAHCGMAIAHGAPRPAVYMFGRAFGPLAAILGFLLISGFSIGHSYRQPRGFYARRIGRIVPALYVSVALYSIDPIIFGAITTPSGLTQYRPELESVLCTLVGLNGFVVGSFLGPTWSLSVELLFYWLTPLFARLRARLLAALIGLSALAYWAYPRWNIGPLPGALYGIAAASLFWAWGAGFLFSRRHDPRLVVPIGCLGVLLLDHYNDGGGVLFAPLTFTLAWLAISLGDRFVIRRDRVRSLMNYLGDISYPLYLIHYPLIVFLSGVLHETRQPVLVAASLAAAALVFHGVERPLRRPLAGAVMVLGNQFARLAGISGRRATAP